MAKGILGRKLGMTQIFDAAGNLIPVTVVDCTPNVVLQHKTVENDGYEAVQVGFMDKRESLSNKPEKGHVAKANTAPKRFIREFRFSEAQGNELVSYTVGQEIKCDIFAAGDVVDVTGTSKGKGFAGTIKRYNHARLRMSHGTSACHRIVGSMGAIKGNLKGKKMPGHMGHETVTLQNLTIAAVDATKNVILVKGNVPGPKKGLVVIKTAVKSL
ncbi:MAG: 50S ribosomal protein L3 [Clostridium sp.]|nr:MAG: 50S ribosomal protein L3 [Clostridium sp.]